MIVWLMYNCFAAGGFYMFIKGLMYRDVFSIVFGGILVAVMYAVFLDGQE